MRFHFPVIAAGCLVCCVSLQSEVVVTVDRNEADASRAFVFKNIPSPARKDAAAAGEFAVIKGEPDRNGGAVTNLNDARLPASEDAPRQNFFFAPGTEGGRLLLDLKEITPIRQVNSFSWHSSDRAPQVYVLYAAGNLEGAETSAAAENPESAGWKRVARVDTRRKSGEEGGQHGVSISDDSGALGEFRYLLFDIERTEDRDSFGNTFYSEIDVIHADAPDEPKPEAPKTVLKVVEVEGGKYRFTFDLTLVPDLAEWNDEHLVPVVVDWYPKLVAMLPSEGYQAPTNVTIRFREDMGGTPASAGRDRINCNADWFRRNLQGEAVGSVVHEMVHVVQNYGLGRRNNPNAHRNPGWVVEGIPDYIRWFLYEPESNGADITERSLARAKYDASYRITGNFFNWIAAIYGREVIWQVNAAAREGKYSEELWQQLTGKSIETLGADWRAAHEARVERLKANRLSSE